MGSVRIDLRADFDEVNDIEDVSDGKGFSLHAEVLGSKTEVNEANHAENTLGQLRRHVARKLLHAQAVDDQAQIDVQVHICEDVVAPTFLHQLLELWLLKVGLYPNLSHPVAQGR